MGKLLGYQKGVSKKTNKPYCRIIVAEECTKEDNNRGCFGTRVTEIFAPEAQIDYLDPKHVGHDINVSYNIAYGRAYVNEISVK